MSFLETIDGPAPAREVDLPAQPEPDPVPAPLLDAQRQRSEEIAQAQRAQHDLEIRLGGQPVVEGPAGLADPALEAQRVAVEAEWQDVRDAFAAEFRIVAASPGSGASDPVAAYREQLQAEPFDARYRERILASAQAGVDAQAVQAAIDARIDADAASVEAAMRSGGGAAAFDALVAAKDGLARAPITVAGAAPGDPAVLAQAQQQMDERLRPLLQQIAADAPADLRQRALAPAGTRAEQYQRAEDVSARLELYASVLPADLVPALVASSRDAWAPSIAFLGAQAKTDDSSHPRFVGRGTPVAPQMSRSFSSVVAHFSGVGEALAASPGGDAALDGIAAEFARAVDPGDIGAFDEAFGRDGVGRGGGAHLAVQVTNHLAGNEATRASAGALLNGLKDGNALWADNARQTLADFAHNRDALTQYIQSFPGGVRALDGCDLRDTTDATALELRDAIADYLQRDRTGVLETDERLLQQIERDGLHLLHNELALQGLSAEAMQLDEAGEVVQPLREMLEPDDGQGPALWQIYANTPGVRAEMADFTAQAAAVRQTATATAAAEPARSALEEISASQSFLAMPRNARFLALELVHARTGVPGLQMPILSDSALLKAGVKTTGVGFFGAAAGSAYIDALGLGNPQLDGWDRAIAGVRGANYTYIGLRDGAELVATVTRSGSLRTTMTNLLHATGPDAKAYHGAHTVLARGLQLGSRFAFIGTDAYALSNDIADGRSGGVITGDALNLAGSGVMFGEAFLVARGSAALVGLWGGPVAWAGTALWTAGAVVKYQAERVEQSNRYETAEQRRFLSHFGSRNDDGTLRVTDPNAEVEVSDAIDHDPENARVRLGDAAPDDIVYTGLSSDAVDELMNYSGSPEHPVSGIAALDALAASRGIDARDFYLQWFSNPGGGAPGLQHEQREALTVAAQAVDPASAGRGISDESLVRAWQAEWPQWMEYFATPDPQRVSPDDLLALQDYVAHEQVVSAHSSLGGGLQVSVDAQRLRGLLGLAPPAAGQQAPSPQVRAAAEKVLGDTAGYSEIVNDGGFRPQTVDELGYWMQLHGYPPLPAAPAPCDVGPSPAASPIDHGYIVQPGDTLWDVAERTLTPTELDALIDYHNSHNPALDPDFDAQRTDGAFDTPHASDDTRRDPDLIQPGETVQVADAADIAPP